MKSYRPDRVVRVLTVLVSIAYFGLLGLGLLLLVATPGVKLFGGDNPDWLWGLPVPAAVTDAEATVETRWGPALVEVEDVRGSLRLPIAILPWWLFALLWVHAAVTFGLMLLFLHHLRRIFQRVRDGAPFDAQNAVRLRWLGLLLVALALLEGGARLVTSVAARSGLAAGDIHVPAALSVDLSQVLVALVLVALAEVFRRGAELEHEQSLVV